MDINSCLHQKAIERGGGKIHVPFLMSEAHVASLAMLQDPVDGQQPLGDSVPRRGLCAANCGQIVG